MTKLGIIGAMDVEVALLKEKLAHPQVTKRAGCEFWSGELEGLPVVIVQCGVGKVNAALCVQILADLFEVTHVVNTGIAGSLDASLDIGDIVISTDVMYHDFHVGPFGYPVGQVPGMDVLAFPADLSLIALAEDACRALGISCRRGRVVSGDQFVCETAVKEQIIATCGGLCTEMEGAAIAHAAYRNKLPVVVLRAISDKADDSATMDYPAFEAQAAKHCAGLTQALARALAEAAS